MNGFRPLANVSHGPIVFDDEDLPAVSRGDALRVREDGTVEKLEPGTVFEWDPATGMITKID